MHAPLPIAAALLLSFVPSADVGSSNTHLTGVHETEHFHVRFRPGSRAEAAVDRTAALAELEYAEILAELGIAGKVDEREPFLLFLYDDLAELEEITGVSGTGGFSAGRESHVPWDNDQTRKHELVHIVVAAMESTGDEPRNMFFAEGIANAVLEYVHGIPVHSVAAYERRRESLPALEELAAHPDFYAFLRAHPGLNAYDVAGSWFLYLLETFPPKKVVQYYHGMPIKKALGKSLAQIEKGWHERLDAFPIRPGLETLLKQRRGDGGEFTRLVPPQKGVPADVLGEPEDWKPLLDALVATDELATWERSDGALRAHNPDGADWSHAEVPETVFGDCVLRLRAKTGASCWGIKIRYGGPQCEAMVLGMGSFLYTPQGGIAFQDATKLRANAEVEIVLRVRGHHAEVWVDEVLLLEADLALSPSKVGIGLVGGEATFTSFAVRRL